MVVLERSPEAFCICPWFSSVPVCLLPLQVSEHLAFGSSPLCPDDIYSMREQAVSEGRGDEWGVSFGDMVRRILIFGLWFLPPLPYDVCFMREQAASNGGEVNERGGERGAEDRRVAVL